MAIALGRPHVARSITEYMFTTDAAVKSATSAVAGASLLRSLRILVHPTERIEGGLTEVEERIVMELARGAGAKKVALWVGAALTDEEVKEKLRAT